MKRIIVSGANGFLGSNILAAAQEAGVEAVAVTRKPDAPFGAKAVSTAAFLAGDFACGAEDVLINCLFPTNADGYRMVTGLETVYQMIARAYESGIGALINISSQSVYASKRTAPAREGDPLCLETPYAVGKYSSEAFVNRVFSDRAHTNVRMASLLGVGYDQRIVNRMVMQALRGEPLRVVGGMQRYGFLDVRDAAAGLVKLALSDSAAWQEAYNLGRNESCSLIDVVECIVSEMQRETGMDVSYTVTEGEDLRNSSVDASLFQQTFDWRPNYTLAETTANIIRSKWNEAGSV
jgi:nucleoside-diphosphate-sugar epimerase